MKVSEKNTAFTKKTAAMQRLADLVRTGHTRYVGGTICSEKAWSLSEKFRQLYSTDASDKQAHESRKRSLASVRFVAWFDESHQLVHWFLVASPGELVSTEKWKDALTTRVELTGYELVRHTRAGAPKPAWTWRYQAERERDLRDSLVLTVRQKREDQVRQLIHAIARTPGFAAARQQVKKMYSLIRSEWKRTRGKDPLPDLPVRVGYVRRLSDRGIKLQSLITPKTTTKKEIDNVLSQTTD